MFGTMHIAQTFCGFNTDGNTPSVPWGQLLWSVLSGGGGGCVLKTLLEPYHTEDRGLLTEGLYRGG